MNEHSPIINFEERRLKAGLSQIAKVVKDLDLIESMPVLVATPQPISVNVEQGAALLGVAPKTLKKQIESGKLRTFKVGRRLLIRLDALNAFAHALEDAEAT